MAELLWWHRVGRQVVFVGSDGYQMDRRRMEDAGVIVPVLGELYTVRCVILHAGGVGFRLVEIVNREMLYREGVVEPTFCSLNFRPARDTSIESLRDLPSLPPEMRRRVLEEMVGEVAHG